MKNRPTEKLLEMLTKIKDEKELKRYIKTSSSEKESLKLSKYILEVCNKKDIKKSEIIRNADIYRTYGYEILNGSKLPSRDKLLRICIGNKFSLKETNRCLTLAKHGILYAKNPRDSIIIFAINNKLSLIETDILLDDHGLKVLD